MKGVVMAPTFGTERRGAPVFTSLKLSKQKIYDLSPIMQPDILVILDYLLLDEPGVLSGLKSGGLIVVNSPKPPQAHSVEGMRVAGTDVTNLSASVGVAYRDCQLRYHRLFCQSFRASGY